WSQLPCTAWEAEGRLRVRPISRHHMQSPGISSERAENQYIRKHQKSRAFKPLPRAFQGIPDHRGRASCDARIGSYWIASTTWFVVVTPFTLICSGTALPAVTLAGTCTFN